MKDYGLVFTGGGTRGAYEIGAWKAFKELGLNFKSVAGTSIGAINGALFVQNSYDIALNAWTNMDMAKIMKYEENSTISLLVKAIKNGGLDISPLKNLLLKYIDEDKIRKSPIDYGLVTYSVTDMKPVMLNKKDIPKGKLIDYIIASASYPLFKLKDIDGNKYIDGGLHNNMPISLVTNSGIKDVICVDVSSWMGKDYNYTKSDFNLDSLTIIKASGPLGRILDFNLSLANRSIDMGYYDTMRAFGNYYGKEYYFKPETLSEESLMYPLSDKELISILDELELDNSNSTRSVRFAIMRNLYKYCPDKLTMKTLLPACLEISAEVFEIERIRNYSMDELLDLVLKKYEETVVKLNLTSEGQTVKGKFIALDFNNISKKSLVTYLLSLKTKDYINKKLVIQILPKVFITCLFFNLIFERKNKEAALA